MELPVITATVLSRYLRLDRCGRYLRFTLQPAEAHDLRARYGVGSEALSPLLAEYGQVFEAAVSKTLTPPVQDLQADGATGTLAALLSLAPGATTTLLQAEVDGRIGAWPCRGRADIIRARRDDTGTLHLRVTDIKASASDNVEYRLQVAFYLRLLTAMLVEAGAVVGESVGAVLLQRNGDSDPIDAAIDAPFDHAPYDQILDQWLIGPDAEIARVLALDIGTVPYALTPVCDGCTHNQLCMVESAERQDIAIVPTIQPATIQVLKRQGVRTLRELATLKSLPETGKGGMAFPITPGKEQIVAALNVNPVIGPQCDRLVQRARAIARRFDPTIANYPYLLDGDVSQLPGDEDNVDLVKIFLDAQIDFLRDRIYLAGFLIEGPNGSRSWSRCTAGPPTTEDEAALLSALLQALITALPEVAADPERFPFHLYLFDQFEQRIWLDALSRHMEALCTIPAFYDLLTASDGIDEAMFAFLAHEIRERKNLGMTCQNLYRVATHRHFVWADAHYNFRDLFHDRVFDGAVQRADGIWIERRSQFNSHIPLEYAYGAWGKLPIGHDPRLTARYRTCTITTIEAFQKTRLRALAHLEAWLNPRHASLIKTPFTLAHINSAPPLPERARALAEFLGMEHHARRQSQLALLRLPFPRRIQTGRCLLLRCTHVTGSGKNLRAEFELDFAAAGLPEMLRSGVRLKEGDWLVLNDLERQQPWTLLRGRVVIVTRLDSQDITLDLTGTFAAHSQFKYPHATDLVPVPGAWYTVDEMVDDLNADKYLQAVLHADNNRLFAEIAGTQAHNAPADGVEPEHRARLQRRSAMFAEAIHRVEPGLQLTKAQAAVVYDNIGETLLCVQGPPGTGKTRMLGWAILARIFATDRRPLRIFVCAKTHKATNLILESIARCWGPIAPTPEGRSIGQLRIAKIQTAPEELPTGVHGVMAHQGRAVLASEGVTILGGTPGGLYSLMRHASGKQIDWDAQIFALVVIDEASQMGQPEALLATAFMQPTGAIIVVGDHRQMPPILAHDWDRERRRSALAFQPARSIFKTLIDQMVPTVKLNESFRLHKVQARFLAEQIYRFDELPFHSQRTDRLRSLALNDPYTRSVLDPAYPIVLIEHEEGESQQFNAVEIALIAPLVTALLDEGGIDRSTGLGIVVPHNAQKAALRQRFPDLDATGAIDTVERFQGGEREVIIVSATVSDPTAITAEAGFLLNLNRLNVAFSRAKVKLIVIASRNVLRFLCGDLELFEQALLWRRLQSMYATVPLWSGQRAGTWIHVTGMHGGRTVVANGYKTDTTRSAPIVVDKPQAMQADQEDETSTPWMQERSMEVW